jgi:hypothetical protein
MARALFSTLLVYIATIGTVSADFVVVVGNPTSPGSAIAYDQGTRATLGIYAYNSGGVDLGITSMDLAFDISTPGSANHYDGIGIPGGTSFFSAYQLVSPLPGATVNLDTDPVVVQSGAPGHDYVVNISSQSVNFVANGSTSNNLVHVADMSFDISPSTPAGVYGFKFVPNATFSGNVSPVNFVTNNPTLAAGADGFAFNQFEVSAVAAVPEPGTIGLVGLAVAGAAGARRRLSRRRAGA